MIPLSDQIAEIRRELSMRERVYPVLIGRGKLTKIAAARNNERMRAALATLEEMQMVLNNVGMVDRGQAVR